MEDIADTIGAKALTIAYNKALVTKPIETAVAVKAMRIIGSRMVAFADAVDPNDDTPLTITVDEFEEIVCDLDSINAAKAIAEIKAFLNL